VSELRHALRMPGLILATVAMAYVGSYVLLSRPAENVRLDCSVIGSENGDRIRYPAYRFGGRGAEWLFGPANYFDKCFRPSYWYSEIRPERGDASSGPERLQRCPD